MRVQAERLREILTSLGPAFVKIGQVTCPTLLMRWRMPRPPLFWASSSMEVAGPCRHLVFHAALASHALSTIRNKRKKQGFSWASLTLALAGSLKPL